LLCGRHGELSFEQPRHMQCFPLRTIVNLVPATGAIGFTGRTSARAARTALPTACVRIDPSRGLARQPANKRIHLPKHIRLVRAKHHVTRVWKPHDMGMRQSFFESVGRSNGSSAHLVQRVRGGT
jgi:hypothetical protein